MNILSNERNMRLKFNADKENYIYTFTFGITLQIHWADFQQKYFFIIQGVP